MKIIIFIKNIKYDAYIYIYIDRKVMKTSSLYYVSINASSNNGNM